MNERLKYLLLYIGENQEKMHITDDNKWGLGVALTQMVTEIYKLIAYKRQNIEQTIDYVKVNSALSAALYKLIPLEDSKKVSNILKDSMEDINIEETINLILLFNRVIFDFSKLR